ncbi:MAG: hypothetical protein ACTSQA_02185 [Candidatus Heimdallarchaeaceae archaeon]|jgi:hypothetical protein
MNEDIQLYEAIYEAMENSYRVIVKREDPYHMMEDSDLEIIFAHHLDSPITVSLIENMIKWWEKEEQYEMCAELKHIENEIKRLSKRYKGEGVTHIA